jgi:apolipoprotein D and lipocalin family protein
VASQVDASLTRLNGDWVVVQGQGVAPGTRVRFGAATVAVGSEVQSLAPLGQGRFMLGSDEVWIYWLDADNRTAALGDPGGRRVWIMDRKGEAGERLRAAREILTWYGYDMTRLEGA